MSIAQVTLVRPLPNRLDEFISRLAEGKKILERHGSEVSYYRTLAGSQPNAVLISSHVDDWAQVAQVSAKLAADPEWQAFERNNANDPAGEVLSQGLVQGFELPV